ncbi:MAG: propanediol utilization protein [Roseovarius sp.]
MRQVTVHGHFGEWFQGRIGASGPVALVTLVCTPLVVTAPSKDEFPFTADQLAGFARAIGVKALPGARRNFPLGIGAGGSTATLVAAARSAGFAGPPDRLARACLAVEGATDPLMYDAPDSLLWASRSGEVLRRMPPPPRAAILGGLWGAPVRTDAKDVAFEDVSDLARDWAAATEAGDLPRVAAIASESARRCIARRGPDDPMNDLARDLGALGTVRAHTGSARGLVFAPGQIPPRAAAAMNEAGLEDILGFETGGT